MKEETKAKEGLLGFEAEESQEVAGRILVCLTVFSTHTAVCGVMLSVRCTV